MTAFTAASALSYILTMGLKVYPKYDCLLERDWNRLYDAFFKAKGREVIVEEGRRYFPSKLFYRAPERAVEFLDESSTNCRAYNERIEKPGCSTLVAFYSTPHNLQMLAKKINPQIAGNMTFFSVVKQAEPMNRASVSSCNRAKL